MLGVSMADMVAVPRPRKPRYISLNTTYRYITLNTTYKYISLDTPYRYISLDTSYSAST